MIQNFLYGLITSLGLIVAIGSQNAFVFTQGILKRHIFIVCCICILSDILLIGIGVFGLGEFFSRSKIFIGIVTIAGIVFLVIYGILSFLKIFKSESLQVSQSQIVSKKTTILKTLAVTYLNPHVYLDTIIIIGGIASTLLLQERWWFFIGSASASLLWFVTIGIGSRLLASLFRKEVTWKILHLGVAIIMGYIAVKLGIFLFQL